MHRNTPIYGQSYWIQPIFAITPVETNVNVWRLDSLVRVEVESIATYSEHCWHRSCFLPEYLRSFKFAPIPVPHPLHPLPRTEFYRLREVKSRWDQEKAGQIYRSSHSIRATPSQRYFECSGLTPL